MWNSIKNSGKPVVLYGTGNAAEKIIAELYKRNIAVAGIFASDSFVRKRSFAGFPVMSYKDAKTAFGAMTVLLCFGSELPEVLDNILLINREQELYAPDLPVAGDIMFSEDYKNEHIDDIEFAMDRLADEQSRRVFQGVLDYKLTGRIDELLAIHSPVEENWSLLDISDKEAFLDLGAYNGDTVKCFLSVSRGRYDRITAVEPDKRNFRKLSENTATLADIELINKAVGSHSEELRLAKSGGRAWAVLEPDAAYKTEGYASEKLSSAQMTTVDEILAGRSVSLIKMDLEGQEAEALRGASESIKKYRPKMLVSAYHRNDDLWELPKLISELKPDYKFYLRKSPCLPAWEINYYIV